MAWPCEPKRLGAFVQQLLAPCLLLWFRLEPPLGFAWASGTIRKATITIETLDEIHAKVQLHAELRIDGGWVQFIGFDGLGDQIVLDPNAPPVFEDAQGKAIPFRVVKEGGQIALRFNRRVAPKRGDYHIAMTWFSPLRTHRRNDGLIEAEWSFPLWRHGLNQPEIRWILPPASAPLALPSPRTESSVQVLPDGRSVVTFRRLHLPQFTEWTVAVRWLPSAPTSAGPSQTQVTPNEALSKEFWEYPSNAPLDSPSNPSSSALIPSIITLLIATALFEKRRFLERLASAKHLGHLWQIPLSSTIHRWLCVALILLAIVSMVAPLHPALLAVVSGGVILLSFQRKAATPLPTRAQSLLPVDFKMIEQARKNHLLEWIGPHAYFEPTRFGAPLGIATMCLAFPYGPYERLMAALLWAAIFSSSERLLGISPATSLWRMARLAKALCFPLDSPLHLSLRLLARKGPPPWDTRIALDIHTEAELTNRLFSEFQCEVVDQEGTFELRISARRKSAAGVALRKWSSPSFQVREGGERLIVSITLGSASKKAPHTIYRHLMELASLSDKELLGIPHPHSAQKQGASL
ncbi:MAG: hypothetical protein NZM37_02500 [Sandaracinaceae bacterium]|nr:hypothetical protein [Sandaracinaceae bacterium]